MISAVTSPALDLEMVEVPGAMIRSGDLWGPPKTEYTNFQLGEVSPFWLATTEVTRAQYQRAQAARTDHPSEPSFEDYPQAGVTWWEAARYCNRLSVTVGLQPVYRFALGAQTVDDFGDGSTPDAASWDRGASGFRLPTDAEWVWAAMGARPSDATSREPPSCTSANLLDASAMDTVWSRWGHCNDFAPTLAPTASYGSNRLGLFDMYGNVAGWTWGEPDSDTPERSRVRSVSLRDVEQLGAVHNSRGESWADSPGPHPFAAVRSQPSDAQSDTMGFRLARNATADHAH